MLKFPQARSSVGESTVIRGSVYDLIGGMVFLENRGIYKLADP